MKSSHDKKNVIKKSNYIKATTEVSRGMIGDSAWRYQTIEQLGGEILPQG